MSIGLYIDLAPLYLKYAEKLQEKRFDFIKSLTSIIPENVVKVSKIKCFKPNQQTLNRICKSESIELLKMKLSDIVIEHGLLANCDVSLMDQDNPNGIALRYIANIIAFSFILEKVNTVVTVYKTGKISINKIADNDKEEIVQKIIQLTC